MIEAGSVQLADGLREGSRSMKTLNPVQRVVLSQYWELGMLACGFMLHMEVVRTRRERRRT